MQTEDSSKISFRTQSNAIGLAFLCGPVPHDFSKDNT